jgi:hypothetical protein
MRSHKTLSSLAARVERLRREASALADTIPADLRTYQGPLAEQIGFCVPRIRAVEDALWAASARARTEER